MGVSDQVCLMTTHNSLVSTSSWLSAHLNVSISYAGFIHRISPSCNYPPWHFTYVDKAQEPGMNSIYNFLITSLLSHVPPSTHHFLSALVGANSGNQSKPFTMKKNSDTKEMNCKRYLNLKDLRNQVFLHRMPLAAHIAVSPCAVVSKSTSLGTFFVPRVNE